jgi:hypothetical protein
MVVMSVFMMVWGVLLVAIVGDEGVLVSVYMWGCGLAVDFMLRLIVGAVFRR